MNYYQRREIFEAFERVKNHDPILTNFVYQHLIPIIKQFLAMYRIDEGYLCHVDYGNLVGNLNYHFWFVVEQYEIRRWVDCDRNRASYIFRSLRRETNRLLHEELDKFKNSSEEKYEFTISPQKWKRIDMDARYSGCNFDELQFDTDRWTDKERRFLDLLLEKNRLRGAAEMMGMSYSSAKRVWNRLKQKMRERNRGAVHIRGYDGFTNRIDNSYL